MWACLGRIFSRWWCIEAGNSTYRITVSSIPTTTPDSPPQDLYCMDDFTSSFPRAPRGQITWSQSQTLESFECQPCEATHLQISPCYCCKKLTRIIPAIGYFIRPSSPMSSTTSPLLHHQPRCLHLQIRSMYVVIQSVISIRCILFTSCCCLC